MNAGHFSRALSSMKGTLVLRPYWWFWKIFCSNLGDEPQKQNVLFSFDPEQQASCLGSVLVRQTCEGARRQALRCPLTSVGSTRGLRPALVVLCDSSWSMPAFVVHPFTLRIFLLFFKLSHPAQQQLSSGRELNRCCSELSLLSELLTN